MEVITDAPIVRKRRRYTCVIFIVALVILIGAAIGSAAWWYQDAIHTPASSDSNAVALELKPGDTILDLATALRNAGGLKSVEALRVYLRINNENPKPQIGVYAIPKNLNIPDFLALVEQGPRKLSITATIQEGLRFDEHAGILATAFASVPGAKFSKQEYLDIATNPDKYDFSGEVKSFLAQAKPAGVSLEGYLFPDTYNIGVDATAMDIISLQVTTLIRRLDEANIPVGPANPSPLRNFHEVLTLASTVQREAYGDEEKAMIADIFLRRLKEGLGLGSDATLFYPYKRWRPGLTLVELNTDTPYNSRLRITLPPTPICNPGIAAIEGVVNHTANNYYYFIHDKDGIIRYGRTFAEHTSNITRYGLADE